MLLTCLADPGSPAAPHRSGFRWGSDMADDDKLESALSILQNAEADHSARQIADALVSAHVGMTGKVHDELRFKEAIAAAIIAARTEGAVR